MTAAIYQIDNTLESSNGEVNGTIRLVNSAGVSAVTEALTGSATYDAASLADGAGATTTVTVTGAALGDFALVSFGVDLAGVSVTAYVSAANTVSVRLQNESGGVVDLASTTIRARVLKAS